MTADCWTRAIAIILDLEGGDRLVDDPRDPGGLTRWGISARAHPGVDIRGLTREGAEAIYRRDYWEPMRCDAMPWPWAIAAMDGAVQHGVRTAAQMVQRAVRVADDGRIGPVTLEAIRRAPAEALDHYLASRAVFYARLPHYDRFGTGWMRRLMRIARHAWTEAA